MITVLGIDCAVDPRKRGVARGRVAGDRCRVDEAWRGDRVDLGALVREALAEGPVLLALDAPLGWPRALGEQLGGHRAGEPLAVPPHDLFRRRTDVLIARRLGKTPLDVGADRIARTAWAALRQLADTAAALGETRIPLLVEPTAGFRVAAVEVYPAGLLTAAAFPVRSGYKPAPAVAARSRILARLEAELDLADGVVDRARRDADVLDAVLCVLAGWDVTRGRAVAPAGGEEHALAGREGWIWNRPRQGEN